MTLHVWLPDPMLLQGGSLSLVPCSFQGISLTETPGTETPSTETPPPPRTETPYGKDRAVRILLECILVSYYV